MGYLNSYLFCTMPSSTHHFTAPLSRFPGKGGYYHVEFPHVVEKLFGTKGSVRVLGTFNGYPMDRALIPRGDGTHYLIFSGDMRRLARLAVGDAVRIELWRNETPHDFQIPEELSAALDLEPSAQAAFERLKPGVRRGMAIWVDQAKSLDVRARRATDMLGRIMQGEFLFGGQKINVSESDD